MSFLFLITLFLGYTLHALCYIYIYTYMCEGGFIVGGRKNNGNLRFGQENWPTMDAVFLFAKIGAVVHKKRLVPVLEKFYPSRSSLLSLSLLMQSWKTPTIILYSSCKMIAKQSNDKHFNGLTIPPSRIFNYSSY